MSESPVWRTKETDDVIRFAVDVLGGQSALLLKLRGLLAQKRAVTAVEYAIIAGVLAVAIVTGMRTIGPSLANIFTSASSEL